jgi:hypothetical protein
MFDKSVALTAWDEERIELDDRDIAAECQAAELLGPDDFEEYTDAEDWTLYSRELRRLGIRVRG